MNASISFKDQLTPALKEKLAQVNDKKPILQAMAGAAVSVAERAFTEERLRPAPWPNKKDGSKATLKGNPPLLARSLMALLPSGDVVEIGVNDAEQVMKDGKPRSCRQYARAQNFGYPPNNLPARPFWPFVKGGTLFAPAEKSISSAMRAAIAKAID